MYSIRCRLLPPDEEGGMSGDERGFTTAQLHTRHWVLTAADGTTDEVDGEGVVGRCVLVDMVLTSAVTFTCLEVT